MSVKSDCLENVSISFTVFLSVTRAEVSQKAAEVDALSDRLTEEKKRSRDLQWAAEKGRCEADREEESKREELEVRFS